MANETERSAVLFRGTNSLHVQVVFFKHNCQQRESNPSNARAAESFTIFHGSLVEEEDENVEGRGRVKVMKTNRH